MEKEQNKELDFMQKEPHPCQKCGACCASYRVGFYWREAGPQIESNSPAVPPESCEDVSAFRKAMKGTSRKHNPACIELRGKIGEEVSCKIYLRRSSTCRDFMASYEKGLHNHRCDEARAKHGIAPLRRQDWEIFLKSIF
jgi:uncharacterized protein